MKKKPKRWTAAAWEAELDRRVQEVLSGKAKLIPADIVMARGREALKRRHLNSTQKRSVNPHPPV
jgi:hypothetical protein